MKIQRIAPDSIERDQDSRAARADWEIVDRYLGLAAFQGDFACATARCICKGSRLNNLTPAAGERHDEGTMAVIDR